MSSAKYAATVAPSADSSAGRPRRRTAARSAARWRAPHRGGANWPCRPRPYHPAQDRGARSGSDEACDVVVRDRSTRPVAIPRKSHVPVDGAGWVVDDRAVPQDQHPLPVDVAEQVRELLAVPPQLA